MLTVRWPNGKTLVVPGGKIPLNNYIVIDYVKGLSVLRDYVHGEADFAGFQRRHGAAPVDISVAPPTDLSSVD